MVKRLLQLTVVTGWRLVVGEGRTGARARSETLELSRSRVDHGNPAYRTCRFTLAETTYGTLPDGCRAC
ncbi:hypothetical protein CBI38_22595 [Rhodococcus oxybenzonivorans]|uniref:Uncharacterized protein n=1 Tax=Rhodococcus oxybenzonivorans TaxID=1990687 RepID=A0A2S2BZC2_9NOCA|nr:hypothetical protein CBI38_22595 [Rhodococcus oxybenzonivorans]